MNNNMLYWHIFTFSLKCSFNAWNHLIIIDLVIFLIIKDLIRSMCEIFESEFQFCYQFCNFANLWDIGVKIYNTTETLDYSY